MVKIFIPLLGLLVGHTLGVSVDTNSGRVRGTVKEYVGQNQEVAGKFYSFRGIPYAEAPLDDLMWKDPVPVAPWNEEVIFFK